MEASVIPVLYQDWLLPLKLEAPAFRHGEESRKYRSAKHRYIYFATSKTKRKQYMKKLNYQIEPYPKGNNGMYELGTFIESIIIGAT